MVLDKRNLHLRLQEYCDCYMETDPKKEIEEMAKSDISWDMASDPEEVALRLLGLTILYGLRESASKIVFVKDEKGGIDLNVEATGKYKLASPSVALGDNAFRVMRAITHLEGHKGYEPLSLGLRDDRVELGVEFDTLGGKQVLALTFPKM